MSTDYYAILGVHQNATELQIRKRFLALARDQHPDRFQGQEKAEAERRFQAITEAFNVLMDAKRRREHDQELARPDSSPGTVQDTARVYLSRGIKAYKAGKYLEAADNFDRATKADPSNPKAWHHLALACHHETRWLSRAKPAIERACELEPMKVNYLKLAGRIFRQAGDKEKAIAYYKKALQWGGEDDEIQSALEELEGRKKPKSRLSNLFGKI